MPKRRQKKAEDSRTLLHQYMMPEHANPRGTVHGGMIMKMMDEAGAIAAMRHAQRPVVTIAVDSLTFKSPVEVGQLVQMEALVTSVGRTSVEVQVRVLAEDPVRGSVTHTNSAFLVYVALDDEGKPTQAPELVVETPEQQANLEQGRRRQQLRKQLSNA